MNRENLNITFVFIGLVLLQVVILNNINFLGYINPFFYIVFIFYYPVKKIDGAFILLSFFLGLSIDFFSNSGGINAAATLFIAYIRIPVIKSVMGKIELEFSNFSFRKLQFNKTISIIAILTFIHHFIVFGLEYFKLNSFNLIVTKTFLTSIFTIILILISFILFSKKNAS